MVGTMPRCSVADSRYGTSASGSCLGAKDACASETSALPPYVSGTVSESSMMNRSSPARSNSRAACW
jgi:hypothetical protein